ncbi:MAG: hypothetical protein A4E62_01289 [Syntrophorhabdus sp. PtaU1.Bin002]|nr:MAG: hypothetical protein A4E58_02736 [Syntrophorhabdus sp. PtaB.Bin006]OPY71408.1 MAG: hypothetical protein A4E62_01289 [Syntrophorhabdus sp. PtaU1.Bin002]
MGFYEHIKRQFKTIADNHGFAGEAISVSALRPLYGGAAERGGAGRQNFQCHKARGDIIEATFQGARGQAFTDRPGDYKGHLRDVLSLNLSNSFERAVFIASLNAVMRHIGYVSTTIHCTDGEQEACAAELREFIKKCYGRPRIALVGFQPAMAAGLARSFQIKIVDFDVENIGKKVVGVIICGPDRAGEVIDCCDLTLVTGSTVVDGTIERFLKIKPVIFYGVTIASVAEMCGYARFCPCSH